MYVCRCWYNHCEVWKGGGYFKIITSSKWRLYEKSFIVSWLSRVLFVFQFQVTGGGSGLGREIALELARKGCKLAVVDVNSKGCYETVEMISKIPKSIAKAYKVCMIKRFS